MSTDGSTLITWPDQERRYRLGIGELRELEDKCNAGAAEIFRAISASTWRVDQVRETIRLGLIGGGEQPQKALALVARYVVPGQLMVCVGIAQTILFAALVGDPADAAPKGPPENSNGSTSRGSMDQEPSSDGHPAKSINAHSLSSQPQ